MPTKLNGAAHHERMYVMRITEYRTKINKETGLNELVKERARNYNGEEKLSCPQAIFKMMKALYYLDERAEEYMYMLALDTKCKPIGIFEIGHGTVNTCLAPVRELYIRALLIGAVNIVLIHNHPSGDTSPSKEDLTVTKRVKEAGDLIGIKLLDHIIIGDSYTSFKELAEL